MTELNDIIQLEYPAVEHLTPSYANEEDVEHALAKTRMRVKELYYELDLRTASMPNVSVEEAGKIMVELLLGRYEHELLRSIAHKAPVR